MEKDISWIQKDFLGIKQDIANIKIQTFNHIPTMIQELKDEFNQYKESNSKWMIGILVTLVFVLVGLVVNLIK